MRLSEFWELVNEEFGPAYAASLARDHTLSSLGSRTATEALAAGVAPRAVWVALCDDMDVPSERRLGPDLRQPPRH